MDETSCRRTVTVKLRDGLHLRPISQIVETVRRNGCRVRIWKGELSACADNVLDDDPLRYNLEPKGLLFQGKYRIARSRFWTGFNYAYARTEVDFEAPAGTPGLPSFTRESNVGGLTPSFTHDSRDNMFTPTRGTYVEATAGFWTSRIQPASRT